jgi:hypothetical protein
MGYDPREDIAYRVAERSLYSVSDSPDLHALRLNRLRKAGLYYRPTDKIDGRLWDMISGAPMSTEFSLTRFLVFCTQFDGWALFCDCDVLFLEDPENIMLEADSSKAVQVVQHDYKPSTKLKMDNQIQSVYPRKNWSSVMLINCSHRAHQRLSLADVNGRTGRELHGFYWLKDSEIGALNPRWNWLVGEQPRPSHAAIAHYTLGVPAMPGFENSEHADLWWAVHNQNRCD